MQTQVSIRFFEAKMSSQSRNVQKMDIHSLDAIRTALTQGLNRLRIRQRSFTLHFWRGSFSATETVTTVEPNDAGR
jgi:hypothetical protein